MNTAQKTATKRLLYGSLAAILLAGLGYHEYQMQRRLRLARQVAQALREALDDSQAFARR
jgi:hypothetical protein